MGHQWCLGIVEPHGFFSRWPLNPKKQVLLSGYSGLLSKDGVFQISWKCEASMYFHVVFLENT